MTKAMPRTVLLSATILGACAGAPRADVVQTGPAAADTTEADAIAALRALDDIPETRVCITPELCGDLRAWRPEALYVLDGHLTALGGVHAFVRMGDAWVHHALPDHTTPMTNGHALFFCDREGTVLELSSTGLRRRGALESPACAAVVASGERLYVVRGDGPVLRQEGNGWRTLDFELRYGNGYSVNTVAMTATRAFAVNEEGDLLELPSEGSSGEPRLVAELQLGHMATMVGVPGTERIIASSGDGESSGRAPVFALLDAVVEGGVVRRVARTLEVPGVPRREPTETGSDGSENESEEEEEESYEEEGEESEAEGDTDDRTLDLGVEIVGLDPLLIAHRSATFDVGSRVGTIAIEHFLLAESGWTPLATAHPEVSHIEVGQGAFGTDLSIRTLPIHVGPFRVVVNRYQGHARGPTVTAWRGDGTDVALTAFDLETHSSLPAGCDGEGGTICRPLAEGQFLRAISAPPGRAVRRIELVGSDGTVRLSHDGASEIRMAELAGAERLYVAEGTRPLGFVDASGYHALSLPAGERVERIRGLANGSAYVSASDDRLYFVDGASLVRIEHAETFADAWLYDVGDGCVGRLDEGGFVWLHGSTVDRLVLDEATTPEDARSFSPAGVALAAPNGTTWLLQNGEVRVVTAPAPDDAHRGGPRYVLPDEAGVASPWEVSFERPSHGGTHYLTPAPTPRSLGPLTSFTRPYRRPLALLARRDAGLTQSENEGTPQPTSLLAYWEHPENTGMRPTRWAGAVVVADPAMSTVVFLTQPLFAADGDSPPRVVARLVGGRATGASSPRDDAAAHARTLVTAEMSEADAFALNDGRAGVGDLVGIVPSGPRASELLRVRIERGRTVVLEVIDRENTRATRVGTTTIPARSVLTFATAAVSSDGTHVAVALGVRPEADQEGARATASHLVLPLPPAPSAE